MAHFLGMTLFHCTVTVEILGCLHYLLECSVQSSIHYLGMGGGGTWMVV